jgi:putative hemolysin
MPKYKYLPKSNIKKKEKTVVNVKDIKIPSLIKSYLNAGAKICSFPAYDKDFKCLDLLTLFNIKDINNRYEEKFKS